MTGQNSDIPQPVPKLRKNLLDINVTPKLKEYTRGEKTWDQVLETILKL